MKSISAALLLMTIATRALAAPETFVVAANDERTLVKFRSKAAMESFEGKTRAASGRIVVDPAAVGDSLVISVVVDMATLDTGIALRNRHMRENHLHTDEHPRATFEGGRIVEGGGAALEPGKKRRVVVAGTLTIHGVPREVRLPLDLTWDGGSVLDVESAFDVKLQDHEIPRPQILVLRLGEVQKVSVSLRGERAPAAADTTAGPATSKESAR